MHLIKSDIFDRTFDFIENNYKIFLSGVLLIAAFNLFLNLGKISICSWDEARHGVSAYEMIKKGEPVVNTYGYRNDYWNLKPPVSFWAIMAGYKILGFNAAGLRIFSSIAAFITIVAIILLVKYKHGNLASLISGIVLTTTTPFILWHCGRSGDADSIYTMFFVLAMVCIIFLEENIKYLYLAGLFFSLAFLTKSWHSGNILIIGGVYLLISKNLIKLKLKNILLFILCAALPVLAWGIFRFQKDGIAFFQAMINYDLMARSALSIEGHNGDSFFYIKVLREHYFAWFTVLVSGFVAITLIVKADSLKRKRNYLIALLLWVLVPLTVYTTARTKIEWYILPVYPALALCIGALSSKLLRSDQRNILTQTIIVVLVLGASAKNEYFIKNMILYSKPDIVQAMMSKLQNFQEYKGKNIYSQYKTLSADNPYRWEQRYLLCAELYGDLRPVEGNLTDFLEDNSGNALLLAPKSHEMLKIIEDYKLKVVIDCEVSYILTKDY